MNLEIACEEEFDYDWYNEGEYIGTGCSLSATIDRYGPIDIYVEVLGDGDCMEVVNLDFDVRLDTIPSAEFEVILEENNNIQLINQSLNADFYLWDFGDGVLDININPQHQYEEQGDYTITLISKNENECESIIEQEISIQGASTLNIPNAFSPNGDGNNDTWHLVTSNFNPTIFKISIHNRWGEKIYSSTNSNFEWNGFDNYNKQVPSGVYTYFIEYEMRDENFVDQGVVVLVK